MKKLMIELRKDMSKYIKKYQVRQCMICNKANPQFCNSHTVPRFILNNISVNGKLKQSITLMKEISIGIFDEDKGVNNTGTFKNICRECDSKVFSEYENPNNILKPPTQNMLRQIALKNILYYIDKKYAEKGMHEYTEDKFNEANIASRYYDIDFKEDMNVFKRLLKSLNDRKNVEFELFFWEKLDYVVPIAYQGPITLYSDLNGYVVNDIYDNDYRHFMQHINICIFPVDKYSIIMAFNDKSYRNNYNFIKKFKEKTLEEKLYILNYILFYYTEDYYLSPNIDETIVQDKNLISLCSDLNLVIGDVNGEIMPESKEQKLNLLKNMIEVPNLLSEKYKLR